MTRNILGISLLLVAGFFAYDLFFKKPSFKSGTTAPIFSGTLINGQEFDIRDLKGHYVLVDFWGSWCAPCIREIPELKAFYNKYNSQLFKDGKSLQVVSIALEKSDKYTKKMISDRALNWPYHIIDVNRSIMFSKYARLYDVKEVPSKFLINPDGNIIGNNLSFLEMDKLLSSRLK